MKKSKKYSSIIFAKYENIFSVATFYFFVAYNFLYTFVYHVLTFAYARTAALPIGEKPDHRFCFD